MGQFGNQPDFGTKVVTLVPTGDADPNSNNPGYFINPPCALYIGTGGDLLVTVVGGDDSPNYDQGATLFKNIPTGTFMPVMVSYVWSGFGGTTLTTASDIVGIY